MRNKAILIVAHGSKVKETNLTMDLYMEALRDYAGDMILEKAYLQLMEPSVETAIESLYEKGIKELVVFPFFLFKGNHILEDIPAVLEAQKMRYHDLSIQFLDNIGFDENIVKMIAKRVGLL